MQKLTAFVIVSALTIASLIVGAQLYGISFDSLWGGEGTIASSEQNFCGGIAAIQCQTGYDCRLDGSYPDAGGVCVPESSDTELDQSEIKIETAKLSTGAILDLKKSIELAYTAGNFQEVISKYEKLADNDLSDPDFYKKAVFVYIVKLGGRDQAVTLTDKLVAANPDSSEAHNLAGWANLSKKKYELAINHLNKSIELDPNNPSPHLNLGDLYLEKMKFDSARASYREAIRIDPSGPIGALARTQLDSIVK